MRIQAAVARGGRAPFAVEEVELDGPREDEVLVRLVATGLCHTDLATKAAVRYEAGPAVFGHEGAGIVVEVGSRVPGIEVGDHVVLTYRHCSECEQCRAGHPAYCDRQQLLNNTGARPDGSATLTVDGGPARAAFFGQSSFAQYALASPDNTIVVDKRADLTAVAALGCGFQTGAGAVLNVLRPGPGSRLVVFGAGSVGLAALLAARSAGVETLVVVDPVPARRELAERFGATAVDPAAVDVVATIVAGTGGGGATHALDTTGIPAVITQGLASLCARGALVVVGLGRSELAVDVQDLMRNGKTLSGCIEGDGIPAEFIPHLVELYVDGQFPIDELVTAYRYPDINRAVADQSAGTVVKPVLVW